MSLRPFFALYGGKWRIAPRYPAPLHSTIIEPFAGSAGYSLRHPEKNVLLVERDPSIAALWRYLIGVSADEVRAIPDLPTSGKVDDLRGSAEQRLLVSWWLNAGASGPRKTLSRAGRDGVRSDTTRYAVFWGPKVRERIASQVDAIRHWSVIEGDYTNAPDAEATWFVDPPYETAGRYYRFADVDYTDLGAWVHTRRGQVIACENVGASWLPFTPFVDAKASGFPSGGKVSREAIWLGGV